MFEKIKNWIIRNRKLLQGVGYVIFALYWTVRVLILFWYPLA
jgi:hypothetical protein